MQKKKPRIVLINPRVIGAERQVRKAQPPLGIAYLAGVLREKGYDEILLIDAVVEDYDNVTHLDDNSGFIKFGLSDEKMVERIKDFNADIIGISIVFSAHAECACSLADKIKESFPEMPIVIGGNHSSYEYKNIMTNFSSVDFIIIGEGEYVFPEFMEKYFNNQDLTKIPGLVWREGSEIHSNPKAPFIDDLDNLPLPAWDLYPMEKYFEIGMPHNPFVKSGRVGTIMTSRGCPFSCYFCTSANYTGRKFRVFPGEKIVEMVQYMVDKFKIKELQFIDDNFTIDYKRAMEILESIKHFNLRITFPNAIRADLPTNPEYRFEMFKTFKRCGCDQIAISIEHGDQEFLTKVIGKALNLNVALETCKLAQKAGLLVHANFMMGFPFETEELRKATEKYAQKLEADSYSISLATPLPGTKMWDVVEKNDLFMDKFDENRIVYARVNIKPHDISPKELHFRSDKLNRDLNETGQKRNVKAQEKYSFFKGKDAHGDRKYHFIKDSKKEAESQELLVRSDEVNHELNKDDQKGNVKSK
tara:strand:- start:2120 stop:3712 length:1593 start_codon:yes stop_codon:yes gene_type:complete